MTNKDKQDVIAICNILADKMSDSGKVAVQQIIGAVEDMVENEPCEDCISRAAVIRLVEQYPDIIGNRCSGLIADIKHLPSVTPQPKTGHWICHREHCENLGVIPSGLGAYEWCSNCGCGIDVTEFHMNHYNYCPNCGAKMEVEDESDSV